jgi:spermidine synthase
MNFFNYFFPKKVRFPDTKFNKNISLLCYPGATVLFVDGLIESGHIMTQIWRKGIRSLLPGVYRPQKVLLLGLAGGCNAHLVNQYFPKAQITAVEIDPVMVDIGQKYFRLNRVKNLDIVIADALDFVKKLQKSDQFDLTLVDCFVGPSIPKKLENISFLQKLKAHSRYVLINRLWYGQEKAVTARFFRSLNPFFFFVKAHTTTNVLISLV